jgi:DNA-binding LytR/AlgR family response regulator
MTMNRHIVISRGTELHRFPLDALICVTAEGNYSYVLTLDGRETLVSLQLGQIEGLLSQQLGSGTRNFLRVGRGLIINLDYLNHIDVSRQILVLSDCRGLRKKLSASRDALIKVKELVERTLISQDHGA